MLSELLCAIDVIDSNAMSASCFKWSYVPSGFSGVLYEQGISESLLLSIANRIVEIVAVFPLDGYKDLILRILNFEFSHSLELSQSPSSFTHYVLASLEREDQRMKSCRNRAKLQQFEVYRRNMRSPSRRSHCLHDKCSLATPSSLGESAANAPGYNLFSMADRITIDSIPFDCSYFDND